MPIEQADLMEVVRTVWETVLEICLVPTETPPSWSATERLLGNVGISGEWTGVVVVEATIPAARDAACRMFKLENEKLTPDDLRDVLAELTNIVGGNLKSLVPGPSNLSLPAVTTGGDFEFRLRNASLISSAVFHSAGHLLRVAVWEKTPQLAAV